MSILAFLAGLVIGAAVGALVYRKHRDKIEAAADEAREVVDKIKDAVDGD